MSYFPALVPLQHCVCPYNAFTTMKPKVNVTVIQKGTSLLSSLSLSRSRALTLSLALSLSACVGDRRVKEMNIMQSRTKL